MNRLTATLREQQAKGAKLDAANSVEHMMLMAASMKLGTVWVSVREEVEAELRELFKVPQPLRLLWIMPIGHATSRPKAKPRRKIADFTHREVYDSAKLRRDSDIRAWPKD
jgi:nitroreductase